MPTNAGQEMNERTIDKFKRLITMLNDGRNVTEISLAVQLSVHECIQIITQQRITIMDQVDIIRQHKATIDSLWLEKRETEHRKKAPKDHRITKPVTTKHRRTKK